MQAYKTNTRHSPHEAQIREQRRQRDRAVLETIWTRISAPRTCGLCANGSTGPRCSACVLRGLRR